MMNSKPHVSFRAGLVAGLVLIASACSTGASGGDQSGSGGVGTTGSTGGQGAGTGGTPGTGGSSATGGSNGTGGVTGTGGTIGTGGSSNTGGSSATGGSAGTAGKAGTGGAAGGSGGAAGAKGTGGTTATGGTTGTGGTTATGGTTGTGGTTATGGTTGTGGTPGPALAFPGAQGFAKKVTGGRAGTVYHVTNLNDSGAGSFRDAVSASNRIVVFDVGGYVQLVTAISAKSNLTIAGQTAPGGGIGFQGGEISFASQSNIIMRHVRIRPGSDTASTEDDALSLYRAHDVIVDHSSMEFAPWNDIDGVSDDWQNYPVTNITIQDSLIADPTGQQFGAHTESVSSDWSWYRNIFANSHNRNPLAKVNNVFVNNVLYNDSAGYTTHTSTNFTHDIVNNYFIFGPASTGTDNTWYQVDKNQSIYYAGNLKDSNLNGTLDGTATTPYWYQGTGTVLTSPWSSETTATPPLDTPSAARVAISEAGTLPRDPVDALIISQVMTLGKGNDRERRGHRRAERRPLHQPGRHRPAQQRLRHDRRRHAPHRHGQRRDARRLGERQRLQRQRQRRHDEGRRRLRPRRALHQLAGGAARADRGGDLGQLRSLQLRGGVQQRLADLRRLGRAERNGHAGGRQAHRAVPADRRVPRNGVLRLHRDRLGRHRVHEPGLRARHSVDRKSQRRKLIHGARLKLTSPA